MAGKSGRQPKSQPTSDTDTGAPAPAVVAPFLVKTHQMVEDPATDDVIAWTASGTSFVVWNPVELARDILPNHFKHNNFSSFVRQLNTYGFRKVASERWEFTNDHFQRGEPNLISKILRRKPSTTSKTQTQIIVADDQSTPFSSSKEEDQSSSSTTSLIPSLPHEQYIPHGQSSQQVLLQDNEKLKKENQILSVELNNAKRQCQMLMDILSGYVDMSNLNASSQVLNTKVATLKTQCQVKGGNQFKLFGVCLEEFSNGKQETNNKRKRFCNQDIDNIVERPVKMAGFLAL